MNEITSKVYVQMDEQNRIIHCEGGLYTEDGIPRYKLEDGKAVKRTEEYQVLIDDPSYNATLYYFKTH